MTLCPMQVVFKPLVIDDGDKSLATIYYLPAD
jgi:hypothetical protein